MRPCSIVARFFLVYPHARHRLLGKMPEEDPELDELFKGLTSCAPIHFFNSPDGGVQTLSATLTWAGNDPDRRSRLCDRLKREWETLETSAEWQPRDIDKLPGDKHYEDRVRNEMRRRYLRQLAWEHVAALWAILDDSVHQLEINHLKPVWLYPRTRGTNGGVRMGLVRDLAEQLSPGLPARRVLATAQVPILFAVDTDKRGRVGTLTVELIEPGSGDLYPATAVAGVPEGADFQEALKRARLSLREGWPENCDVRWSICSRDGMSINEFSGDSAGGAFQWALLQLLAPRCPALRSRFPDLNTLPLGGIAITAALEPDHRWQPVGGVFEKLFAAARETYPPIHTVIVASNQGVLDQPLPDALGLQPVPEIRQIPPGCAIYRDPTAGFGIIHVIAAKDFGEALDLANRACRHFCLDPISSADVELPGELEPRDDFIAALDDILGGEPGDTLPGYRLIEGEIGRGKTVGTRQWIGERVGNPRPVIAHFGNSDGTREPHFLAMSVYQRLCLAFGYKEPPALEHDLREAFPPGCPMEKKIITYKIEVLLREIAKRKASLPILTIDVEATKPHRHRGTSEAPYRCLPTELPEGVDGFLVLDQVASEVDLTVSATFSFSDLASDSERRICESLLRGRGKKAGLPDGLIKELLASDPLPALFTVDSQLRLLEGRRDRHFRNRQQKEWSELYKAQLRSDVSLWRLSAEEAAAVETVAFMSDPETRRGLIRAALLKTNHPDVADELRS